MIDLAARRRFFAEEVEIASNIRTRAIVEALASVPRERFLPPGPWTVKGEADFAAPPRQTADADPRHVYHNIAIGIDPARMLFNGAPGLLAMAIDALGLREGARVLHVGTGTGYYTAVMAHCVGATGRVLGLEVDGSLAAAAAANLASMPWVEIRQGDGSAPFDEAFDAILVNAGVTHPLDGWFDALPPGARMVLPLTAAMNPAANVGKGLLLLVSATGESSVFDVSVVTFVAIYSALGIRDDAINGEIARALARNPFPRIRHLRRAPHDATESCWLHRDLCCLSLD